MKTVACFLFLLFVVRVSAFVENYIVGTPKVICEEDDVALDVITAKPFQGNIFVKGRAKDPPCRQSYAANGTNSYSLPLGKCGMQRLRSANPRGLSFSVTVIVSFHPAGFITKNDRAFNIKCFYLEPEEVVTSNIEVSQIPTMELSDSSAAPTCEYSVRSGSPEGPQISFSSIGEKVFHVWKCNGNGMGMLVKKCFVSDGDGEDHPVVDENGCASDNVLLGAISYDDSLMTAYATSQSFKFADSNQLFFTCQIKLCQKQMGMCENLTPPKCSGEESNETEITRSKRELINLLDPKLKDIEIDVSTPSMLILDQDENQQIAKTEFCISKIFLPVIPLLILTIACLSSSLSLLCYKNYCSASKIIEF